MWLERRGLRSIVCRTHADRNRTADRFGRRPGSARRGGLFLAQLGEADRRSSRLVPGTQVEVQRRLASRRPDWYLRCPPIPNKRRRSRVAIALVLPLSGLHGCSGNPT